MPVSKAPSGPLCFSSAARGWPGTNGGPAPASGPGTSPVLGQASLPLLSCPALQPCQRRRENQPGGGTASRTSGLSGTPSLLTHPRSLCSLQCPPSWPDFSGQLLPRPPALGTGCFHRCPALGLCRSFSCPSECLPEGRAMPPPPRPGAGSGSELCSQNKQAWGARWQL